MLKQDVHTVRSKRRVRHDHEWQGVPRDVKTCVKRPARAAATDVTRADVTAGANFIEIQEVRVVSVGVFLRPPRRVFLHPTFLPQPACLIQTRTES